ncbi:hypothetical protein H2200_005308 [Cladophialophora chaetospira]|uniref:Uncharacterized protein n=1 Tax=Cladophialophora chaetospira TaxID=386627 RepID=A0AA39CJQ1_9EURO|nr:hypothetical protein H2200_005308 [Cladophialophora chaetospira]
MRSTSLRLLSIGLLAFFLTSTSLAALPLLWTDSKAPQEYKDRFAIAWKDCIELARFAAVSFQGTCDPTYQRFFEEEEDAANFVKNVFRKIANIPFDAVFDDQSAQEILRSDTVTGLSPEYAKLTIALDESPWLPSHDKGYCNRNSAFGALLFNQFTDQGATSLLCPGLMTYPTISEIIYPPPNLQYDAQGNQRPGWGCDGLLERDTELMLSPGAWLLHELSHWTFFLQDIPDYNRFIQPIPNSNGLLCIVDYRGTTPITGYGAYNTQLLKKRVVSNPSDFGPYPTLNNADSYLWYAESKFWTWVCQKNFREAQDPSDDFLRFNSGGVTLAANPNFKPGDQGSDHPLPGYSDFDAAGP